MNENSIERIKQANIQTRRGSYTQLGEFLFTNGNPLNFIISGRIAQAQFDTLDKLIDTVIGRCPLIIFHNHHYVLAQKVTEAAGRKVSQSADVSQGSVWNIGSENLVYEPFYGMEDTQIVKIFRRLATLMGYTVTPRFERIVRAHIKILKEQKIPVSLSSLYYLCGFEDMQEFQQKIMALPCDADIARRIWADLGLDNEKNIEQFDLFRNVVLNFAFEMKQSGWKYNGDVVRVNALAAIRRNATLVYSVNDVHSELFFNYLVDELKNNDGKPFVILLDNIKMDDSYFADFLIHPSANCRIGIVAENAISLMGKDTENFLRLAEKTHSYILFKHKTSGAASVYSEIMGKFDYIKTEYSEGTQRENFKIMPSGHHKDTRYSLENQYRVMPEDIIDLDNNQAYIFDALTNTIYRYN